MYVYLRNVLPPPGIFPLLICYFSPILRILHDDV
jgi:hypothetical protein